jgi:hypothetical protein
MAPTALDKARLLLLSQCDPNSPNPFVSIEYPKWCVIQKAIEWLKHERNVKVEEAKAFLRQLEENGRYEGLLGKWVG